MARKKKNKGIWSQLERANVHKFTIWTGAQGARDFDRALRNMFWESHLRELKEHLLDSIFDDSPQTLLTSQVLIEGLKELRYD